MDTSETYLRMCEQAKEIQDSNPMKKWRGQLASVGNDGEGNFGWCFVKSETSKRRTFFVIWLPRQDQLQEMVQEDAITQIQRLWGWIITSHYTPIGLPQPSMEQLWLAFVMENKYGKAWDGREWVKIPVEV